MYSLAAASWYSGTGIAPSDCAASITADTRGRLSATTTMCWPRRSPAWDSPQASSRTSADSAAHDRLCQMPYSFSRSAGASGRALACSSISRGKVLCTLPVSFVRGAL